MRVLQVITDTDRRGAQVFATDLGAAMAAAGHEVTTVALAPGSRLRPLDVPVLGDRRRSLSTIRALRKRMRDADITVAHGSATGLACALTFRPFVYRQIGDTRFWAAGWSRRIRVALYLRRARHIVALSPSAAQALDEHLWLTPSRITVVPNGVPGDAFDAPTDEERTAARRRAALEESDFVALYIGALEPDKGPDAAIRAVTHTNGARLLIAGGGPQETELRALAEQLQAPVQFLGVVTEARAAYLLADVHLLPSRGGDSMPATLIEASLCCVPSVATPIGSIEDVVLDGITGIVIPADDTDALRHAIERLQQAPHERTEMGHNAREHCLAHFEINMVARQWLEVLERARRR